MINLIKWWKDRNLLSIVIIAIASVILSAIPAILFEWGWLLSIVIAITGGLSMRYFIVKYIKSKFKEND